MFLWVPNVKHRRRTGMEIQDGCRLSAGERVSFTWTTRIRLIMKRLGIKGALHGRNLPLTSEATEISKLWYLHHFRKIPLWNMKVIFKKCHRSEHLLSTFSVPVWHHLTHPMILCGNYHSPMFRWRNQSLGKVKRLPEVIQIGSSRAGIQSQAQLQSLYCFYNDF